MKHGGVGTVMARITVWFQPVGKQYAYGTGPENLSNEQQLRNENNYLKIHIEVLKKYKELERTWSQK